ncbi:MAG: DUF433 domain-containing protein [Flavobacteriales bacterium]
MQPELIEMKPEVCNGKPVLKGTRITVQSVLELLAAGDSIDDVLQAYPSLSKEHVLASLQFAARLTGNGYTSLPLA